MNRQFRKIVKTLLMISLVAAMLLSFGACGKKKTEDTKPKKTTATIKSTKPTTTKPTTTKPTTTKPTVPATTAPTQATTTESTVATESSCEHPKATMKIDKEATCEEEGSQHQECPDCGFKGSAEVIKKTGHTNSDPIVEKEATCIAEGKYYVECTVCKKRLANVTLPKKTEHTPGEWILDKQATSAEDGEAHQECDVCKQVLETAKIPATGSLGLAYEKNADGTYTVSGIGSCLDREVYIPNTYEGAAITAIGDQAFAGCTHVERVIFPATVTQIGNRAFYNSGLKEITIPASVKTLGNQIFFQAENLHTVYYNSDSVEQTTSIFGATSVKKVVFGGTKVPDYACQGAAELEEVVIGDTVDEIGYYSFENCTSLSLVNIPGSVNVIAPGAFKNCTSLSNIAIPDSISTIDEQTFDGCTALTAVTIPDSVIRLNKRAFAGCSALSTVTIPASVTNIGDDVFCDCTGLLSIEFQGSQTQWDKIPKGASWDLNTGDYTVTPKS